MDNQFKPRPMQEEVLKYTRGKMGVTAVPGSGKTHTLSFLAATLITDGYIQDDQEVLIVTLVNSAVDNFTSRVGKFISQRGLIPNLGYRVRTLHGLANDIVRERPDLAGISDRFSIVDENEASDILRSAVFAWLRGHPEFVEFFKDPDVEINPNRRDPWPELAVTLAGSFIRVSKDLQVTPVQIKERLDAVHIPLPLLEMGTAVYSDYQRALNYRSSLDFDDLIRYALKALENDDEYLARLRYQWPYILEDEAQDSSRIQEMILRKLAGFDGNWVRVGDPNQAIYETFTTASPRYLRDFLHEPGVISLSLPNSGRSSLQIIDMANALIQWTQTEHPIEKIRQALDYPLIKPTPPGDPQPNPPDVPGGIRIIMTKYTPDKEISAVVNSIKNWLPDHKEKTIAVLVPRNERGVKIAEELKRNGVECIELLGSSISTRQTASIFSQIFLYLSDPSSSSKLAHVFTALHPTEKGEIEKRAYFHQISEIIRKMPQIEQFLWPLPGANGVEIEKLTEIDPGITDELAQFKIKINRWEKAALLPVDQLLLTISQDLFTNPPELALAHKLALVIERAAQQHSDWHLRDFSEELSVVARNERRFLGFSEEDSGFDPSQHPGKVVVATIHKAKGLEWDRVYLVSVNNYDFPSALPYDSFISEKWFVRNQLNLQAECLSQLEALVFDDPTGIMIEEGIATREARLEYASERLRLLYVGITRAKQELIFTWNTGRIQKGESVQALPLVELAKMGFGT